MDTSRFVHREIGGFSPWGRSTLPMLEWSQPRRGTLPYYLLEGPHARCCARIPHVGCVFLILLHCRGSISPLLSQLQHIKKQMKTCDKSTLLNLQIFVGGSQVFEINYASTVLGIF
jgi:hypothetical protein